MSEMSTDPAAPIQAPRIPTEAEVEARIDAAVAAAVEASNQRVSAILGAPEAKNRKELARFVALQTDLPADRAIDALRASPEEPHCKSNLEKLFAGQSS